MTILRAVRWAVEAWEVGLTSTAITNCFKKAPHNETEEELETDLLVNNLRESLRSLQITNRIRDIMNINQFLDPPDEQVNDSLMDIDTTVLSQFPTSQSDDNCEDIVEESPPPIVTPAEALQSLQLLRLYEEQKDQADPNFLRVLIRYQNDLIASQTAARRQTDIRRFFT